MRLATVNSVLAWIGLKLVVEMTTEEYDAEAARLLTARGISLPELRDPHVRFYLVTTRRWRAIEARARAGHSSAAIP
jgi:hypothetical protein